MSPSALNSFTTSLPILATAALFVSVAVGDGYPGVESVVQGSMFGFRGGSPHVITWGGDDRYEFHGGCDLVLVHNPTFADGLGMDIYVRTKVTNDRWWSFIEAAVLRVGEDVIEVGGGEECGKFWINGEQIEGTKLQPRQVLDVPLKEQPEEFHSQMQQVNSKQLRFRLIYGNGDAVVTLETFQEFVRVDVVVTNHQSFGNSFGLMGSFPDGMRLGRDRKTVLSNVNDFVREWQVQRNATHLFHDALTGKANKHRDCAIGSKEIAQVRRRRLA